MVSFSYRITPHFWFGHMACIATTIVYTRGFACPRTPAREVHHGPRWTVLGGCRGRVLFALLAAGTSSASPAGSPHPVPERAFHSLPLTSHSILLRTYFLLPSTTLPCARIVRRAGSIKVALRACSRVVGALTPEWESRLLRLRRLRSTSSVRLRELHIQLDRLL